MSGRYSRVIPILALAMAGCLWGTGFFFGNIALSEMPVATMILFRMAFTCAGLVPVFFFDRPHFKWSELGWVFAASLLGVPVLFLVQFKGLSLTTVSHASLMVGTLPMLLAVAAMVFSGERLHSGGWLALVASTVGAGLIALSSKRASATTPATVSARKSSAASAIVDSCGATGVRFHYKIPVLRLPFRRPQLVSLVRSAIQPQVRILLVVGGYDEEKEHLGDLQNLVWGYPENFEIELEPNGDDALKRYREHGPYDLVLTGFRHPGMFGPELAQAIQTENPGQRIAVLTGQDSPSATGELKRMSGNLPVLTVKDVFAKIKVLRSKMVREGLVPEGQDAKLLFDAVEAAMKQ